MEFQQYRGRHGVLVGRGNSGGSGHDYDHWHVRWTDQLGRERWTPSFGQVFVTAKVESGFMIQAAFGWPEVGRSPRLRSASSLVYASSGVRPLSDEWGRHRL